MARTRFRRPKRRSASRGRLLDWWLLWRVPVLALIAVSALLTGILHGATGMAGGIVMASILAHLVGKGPDIVGGRDDRPFAIGEAGWNVMGPGNFPS